MALLRKYSNNFTRLALGAAVLLMAGSLSAATFTTQAPGNWTTGATWAGGVAPGATDDVVIQHAVTVTTTVNAKDITINSGGALNLTVSTSVVVATGNLARNGTGTISMGNFSTTYLELTGTAAQSINADFTGSNAFRRLRINKTLPNTVTINANTEVSTQLILVGGRVDVPAANTLTVTYDASDGAQFGVTGSTSAVITGKFNRRIDRSKAGDRHFWVGAYDTGAGVYESALVQVKIGAGQLASVGTVIVSTYEGNSPWPAPLPSGMNVNDILDRYWKIESTGFSSDLAYALRLSYRGPALSPNDFSGSMVESLSLRPVRFYQEIANGNFWTADGTTTQVEPASDRVTVNGLTQPNNTERVWTIFESAALKVDLASLTGSALEGGAGARIDWETAGETNNAGFNVYRALSGFGTAVVAGQRLTSSPIPAIGDGSVGGTYGFVDDVPFAPGETRSYLLEDVDLNGQRTLHGPVTVTNGAAPAGDAKAVANAIANLTTEYWQTGSSADFAAPAFSAEGGLGTSVAAGSTGVFGFWETKSPLAALPAGEYRLRALVDWNRSGSSTLPQLRSRVFPAGHVTSWSTVINDRPGSTIPGAVETTFSSDGETPFRIAFDVLGFGPNVAGGFTVKSVEIVPAN